MEKKYFFVSQIRKSAFLMTVLYVYYNTFFLEYLARPSAKFSLGNCSREEMWNVCDSCDDDNCPTLVTETLSREGDEALLQKWFCRLILTMMDTSGARGPQSGQCWHQTMSGVSADNQPWPAATESRMKQKLSFCDLKLSRGCHSFIICSQFPNKTDEQLCLGFLYLLTLVWPPSPRPLLYLQILRDAFCLSLSGAKTIYSFG